MHNTKSPRYKAIIEDIISSISSNKLKVGEKLPSLIDVCGLHKVSRDTAIKAYQELKTRGIIAALPGKGYYVASKDINFYRKVLLLFDDFSPYKSILYNLILQNLDKNIGVDIYFHHFNTPLFSKLLTENAGCYTDYVIMPVVDADVELFKKLEKSGNVFFLDQGLNYFNNTYPCVCQDFRNDLFEFLSKNQTRFRQFSKLVMQIDAPKNQSEVSMTNDFKDGFESFCKQSAINYMLVEEIPLIEKGTCYLVHSDLQLVKLVKDCMIHDYEIGKDISVISFNENPLKEVINKGISTISTDFTAMGRAIAELIKNNSHQRIINDFILIERNSFQL